MHNKLQYTWRGDYCERLQPAQTPRLNWSSSPATPGTTSTIRSPPGPRRIQHMVGCNNSVWSSIKAVSPLCVQIKCICHSLALCMQYAVSEVPSNIGFWLSEIPNWFRHSELRREANKELFRVMNTATQFEPTWTAPLPFEKTFFYSVAWRGKIDTKCTARLLQEMLSDYKNYYKNYLHSDFMFCWLCIWI